MRNTIVPAEIVGKAGDVCFWVRVRTNQHWFEHLSNILAPALLV